MEKDTLNRCLTLPNLLTISRFGLIIPVFYLMGKERFVLAFSLSMIAFMTDYFDGKIARWTNMETALGALLDPIADKLLVMALMLFFVWHGLLDPMYFGLSFLRDFLQLASVPILLFWKKRFFKVKPKLLPKLATAVKYIILMLLFLNHIVAMDLFSFVLKLLMVLSALLETYVLLTFVPRFYQIYTGRNDTFE